MSFGQAPGGGSGPPGGQPAGGYGQPPAGGFGSPGGGFGPPGGGFGPPGGGFGPPGGGFGPPGGGGAPAPQVDPLSIAAAALAGVSLVTCMCCGIFGIPLPIAAAVCGGISLARLSQEPDRFNPTSKVLAIVGIALGGIVIVLSILALVLGMSSHFLQMAQQL